MPVGFTLQALKSHIIAVSDLATPYNAGQDGTVADLLNDLAGPRTDQVPADNMLSVDFNKLIDGSEWDSLTPGQIGELQLFESAGSIALGDPEIQEGISGMFTQSTFPLTRTRMLAAFTRLGTEAEVIFGTGTRITSDQVYSTRAL